MALIIHSNAILEEIKPDNLTFTDDEILKLFDDRYHTMHSMRIVEVPNTWAVWGSMDDPPSNEYNAIASSIVKIDIDSQLLIMHDSEINPDWNVTDTLLTSYEGFLTEMNRVINSIAADMVNEDKKRVENGEKKSLMTLKQLGITEDKKLLFAFDPNSQSEGFFADSAFDSFTDKILEYLFKNFNKNLRSKLPFTIFDDNKTIVIVDNPDVDATIERIVDSLTNNEKYEECSKLMKIKAAWHKKTDRPKITRTKKKSSNDE